MRFRTCHMENHTERQNRVKLDDYLVENLRS